jgi:hypothetical protein
MKMRPPPWAGGGARIAKHDVIEHRQLSTLALPPQDPPDLITEFSNALKAVPYLDIGAPEVRVGGLGKIRAALFADLWEPNSNGFEVIVCPVFDGPIEDPQITGFYPSPLIDLVAWEPNRPEKLYRRTGEGLALGIVAINRARDACKPLLLFETAEDWIKAGGDRAGAVILETGATLDLLAGIPVVRTGGVEHGTRVELLLRNQMPLRPRVEVPRRAAA